MGTRGAPDSDLFGGLIFKVADRAEQALALDLRRQVYAIDWPQTPVEQVIDDLDACAYHLIACLASREVVAVARIVGPAHRPFDLERFVRLSDVVPADRSAGEIGRLCVRHDHRQISKGQFIHAGMLKLAYDFARKIGLTDLVITSLPQLYNFYRLGFFEPVGITFEHTTWGTVHVMRLNLTDVEARRGSSRTPMARLLFAAAPPNFVI